MRPVMFVVAAFLLGASGAALAVNCPNEIKAIDAKMSSAKLSDADAAKVKKLRADADAAHKAGNHADSKKATDEAKKILGMT